MITYICCIILGFSQSVPRQGEEARQEEGGGSWGRKAHVERLPKPATRIMVEKRTASGPRVNKVEAGNRGSIWDGPLEHEWFERSLETQKRRKRDVNHLKARKGDGEGRGEEGEINKGRKIKACFLYTFPMFITVLARAG